MAFWRTVMARSPPPGSFIFCSLTTCFIFPPEDSHFDLGLLCIFIIAYEIGKWLQSMKIISAHNDMIWNLYCILSIWLVLFWLWWMEKNAWSLVCKAGSNWLITSLSNGHNELQLRGGGSIYGSANTRYTSLSS